MASPAYHIIPSSSASASVDSEAIVCRNCHEAGGGEFISPCLCDGSVKWVHRTCLNDWRAYSTNPRSFTHCDICGCEYQFRIREDVRSGRVVKFALRVCRDFFGAMLVVQAIIWLLTLMVWKIDSFQTLLNVFPKTWSAVGVYYIWGLFIFSLFAAIYGAIYLLYRCTCGKNYNGPAYTYYDYPYGCGPYYMWWYYPSGNSCCPMGQGQCCGGCEGGCCSGAGGGCGNLDCGGGGGNDGGGIAILALVVMIVAITIGVIVMAVIATIILRRHAHVLHKQAEARENEVLDRSEWRDANV